MTHSVGGVEDKEGWTERLRENKKGGKKSKCRMEHRVGNDRKRQVEWVVTHRGGVCLRVCECVRAWGPSF